MNLKKRLARLGPMDAPVQSTPSSPSANLAPQAQDEALSRFRQGLARRWGFGGELEARSGRQPVGNAAATVLPGEQLETGAGTVQMVQSRYDAQHRHGMAPLVLGKQACAVAASQLACDPSLAELDLSKALYLDTETTGLSGGSGTLAFIMGVGFFEHDDFVVKQLVLPRPGHERGMLHWLASQLSQASCVISFNGKSYDWPLLRTRFAMNRLALPDIRAHIDLLHCARRLLGARMATLRLTEIERDILGFERVDDVPGWQIPSLYFDYLRGGGGHLLKPVVDHNGYDILALAALLGELVRRVRSPQPHDDPRDHLALARLSLRAGRFSEVERHVQMIEQQGAPTEVVVESLLLCAHAKYKSKKFCDSAACFLRARQMSCTDAQLAHIDHRLAILYEHKLGDLNAALRHAVNTGPVEGEMALRARLERLHRRLGTAVEDPNCERS